MSLCSRSPGFKLKFTRFEGIQSIYGPLEDVDFVFVHQLKSIKLACLLGQPRIVRPKYGAHTFDERECLIESIIIGRHGESQLHKPAIKTVKNIYPIDSPSSSVKDRMAPENPFQKLGRPSRIVE